jgi:hypothetical protein
MEPEFGVCHLVLPRKIFPQANVGTIVSSTEIGKFGPPWLGTRTYLGHRLVNLVGLDLLQSVAANVEKREWGVIVDLAADPWKLEVDDFFHRLSDVMKKLESFGIFGNYRNFNAPEPGPNWLPIEF